MIFIAGKPDKVRWGLRNTEGLKIRRPDQPEFDPTFSVPECVTLERKIK
jgi:hypothetical protein